MNISTYKVTVSVFTELNGAEFVRWLEARLSDDGVGTLAEPEGALKIATIATPKDGGRV